MFKHIIGQALYQIIIMLILVFAGDQFLPEFGDRFDDEIFKQDSKFQISDKYKEIGKINKFYNENLFLI